MHRAHIPHEVLLRPAGVVGLLGIALIHFLDVFSKFRETPYLGVVYLVLIAGCLLAAAMLLRRDARLAWALTVTFSGATFAAYVLSRTVGLPSARDDIGNWTEPLGLAALFTEALLVVVAVYALLADRRAARIEVPVVALRGDVREFGTARNPR